MRSAPDDNVLQLAHVAFAAAITQIREHVPGARRARDAAHTHKVRVGLRRLRVCLRLFRDVLGEERARTLAAAVRPVFTRLGQAREYDVLLADLIQPLLASGPPEPFELLVAELQRARQKAVASAQRTLSGRRFFLLMRELRLLQRELSQRNDPSPRARKWARKRLDKRLDKVLALRAAAFGNDEEARHDLRKELKKLRYTAELMRGLWSPKRVKRYLEGMSELQDVLGVLNDVAVDRALLARLGARLEPRAQPAIDACLQTLDQRVAAQWPLIEPTFAKFEQAQPFWR